MLNNKIPQKAVPISVQVHTIPTEKGTIKLLLRPKEIICCPPNTTPQPVRNAVNDSVEADNVTDSEIVVGPQRYEVTDYDLRVAKSPSQLTDQIT